VFKKTEILIEWDTNSDYDTNGHCNTNGDDGDVKTAEALLSVPVCPYAGPLLTSTIVEGTVFGVSEGLPR
jgi:hypothetical protein